MNPKNILNLIFQFRFGPFQHVVMESDTYAFCGNVTLSEQPDRYFCDFLRQNDGKKEKKNCKKKGKWTQVYDDKMHNS